jgi:hypothetical protein
MNGFIVKNGKSIFVDTIRKTKREVLICVFGNSEVNLVDWHSKGYSIEKVRVEITKRGSK